MDLSRVLETSRGRAAAGIALKLAAVVSFCVMYALVKVAAGAGVHSLEVVFFRNLFAFIPITAYVAARGGLRTLATRRPGSHVRRGVLGVVATICGFSAIGLMPLGEFTALSFAAPLFITLLSVPFLGEKVGLRRWAMVGTGFVGVLIMVRPNPLHFVGLGAGLALGFAFATAATMIAIRQMGATESGATIAFYFTLFATAVAAISLPFVWTTPSPTLLAVLVACGLAGGIGQLLMTQAFRIGPAAVVAPFEYTSLLWTSLIGYAVWKEVPSASMVLGGAIVIASGLYILWAEIQREPPTASAGEEDRREEAAVPEADLESNAV